METCHSRLPRFFLSQVAHAPSALQIFPVHCLFWSAVLLRYFSHHRFSLQQFIVCSHIGCQMRKQYSKALLSCVPGQPLDFTNSWKTKSTFLDIFFILNMTWQHTDRSWSVWHLCYFLVLSSATVAEQHWPCPHCPWYSQSVSVSDACCIWGTENMCFASILYLLRVVSCLSLLIYVLGMFPCHSSSLGKIRLL